MQRRLVLLDAGKPRHRRILEDIVGIVVDGGDLGGEDVGMAKHFASRIHFAHLRNVTKEPDGSFIESEHLAGDVNMVSLISILRAEERRRETEGRSDTVIPMRPDHGHLLIDDNKKTVNPGYSCIGRLKGLAELRGVIAAVDQLT